MPKATLMVRLKRPEDDHWIRKPAVGSTGRVQSGYAEFKDPKTGEKLAVNIGENFTFEVRVENNGTTYEPAGRSESMPRPNGSRLNQGANRRPSPKPWA